MIGLIWIDRSNTNLNGCNGCCLGSFFVVIDIGLMQNP